MPTYLCHGFRWHRRGIRIFVIVNDLEDAAPDWIMGRRSSAQILGQFATAFGFLPAPGGAEGSEAEAGTEAGTEAGRETRSAKSTRLHHDDDFAPPPPRVAPSADAVLANDWSAVKLLEEYDDAERASAARPYAYVADHVVRVDLSASVADEMAAYGAGAGWFERLRDELQPGEDIRWYVVVCADDERAAPGDGAADDDSLEADDGLEADEPRPQQEDVPPTPPSKDFPTIMPPRPAPTPPAAAVPWRHQQPASDAGRPQPEFLGADPFKSGRPQPGLRHRLSTKGLRRLFSKREAP